MRGFLEPLPLDMSEESGRTTGEASDDMVEAMFWREVEQRVREKVSQMRRAVDLCLAEDLWEPALILLLSYIDAFAWLARPAGQPDVYSRDFIDWVNRYLLPDSNLPCTAEELYGARCGLLHSHTAESKLHREERIRKIFWSRAKESGDVLTLLQLRMNEKFLPVGVGIDHLYWAFDRALQRFGEFLESDVAVARLVGERIQTSYLTRVQRLSRGGM